MGEYLPISATDFPQFLSSNSQSHNLQQFCQKLCTKLSPNAMGGLSEYLPGENIGHSVIPLRKGKLLGTS